MAQRRLFEISHGERKRPNSTESGNISLGFCAFAFQTNKAPYTLPLHTNWFLNEEQVKGLKMFVRWSKDLPGVHYVTVTDYLLWMTDPSAHDAPKEAFKPLEPENNRRLSCSTPNTCELSHTEKNDVKGIRYMRTCEDCPREKYPWLLPPLEARPDDDN